VATDIPIRCECGSLRAIAHDVTRAGSNRVICYCEDCQAFAQFLGQQDRVLDSHGGSEIVQMTAANVEWTQGREHLACMRLSDKGIARWYAACCRSPIGNTAASPAMPFVGLLGAALSGGEAGTDVDEAVGPVRGSVWAKFAKDVPGEASPSNHGLALTVLRFARIMIGARLRGDHKRSAFFDPATHEPIVTPQILTKDERAKLMESVRCGSPAPVRSGA